MSGPSKAGCQASLENFKRAVVTVEESLKELRFGCQHEHLDCLDALQKLIVEETKQLPTTGT
jgi:hypothetical protein